MEMEPNGGMRHQTDLVHWKDEGVAIPKYTNENGDPWSGSVVVDEKNTAGFGKEALVAIVTQPSAEWRAAGTISVVQYGQRKNVYFLS